MDAGGYDAVLLEPMKSVLERPMQRMGGNIDKIRQYCPVLFLFLSPTIPPASSSVVLPSLLTIQVHWRT